MCLSLLPHIANTGDSSYLPSISLLSLSTISTTDRKRSSQAARATSFTNSEVVIEVVRVPLGRIARRLAHLPAALDEGHGGLLLGLLCLARLLSRDAHPAAVYALDVEPPVAYLSTQEARF